MKIAVASNDGQVAEHFGHCGTFLVLDTQTGQFTDVPNPGHKPGFLPNFLADLGVDAIVAGGMGAGAIEIFNARNIRVLTGAQGDARAAAEACSRGELASSGSVCQEHAHHGE